MAAKRGSTGTSMGGSMIRIKRGKDPARTGTCPVCQAMKGERCFNVSSPGGKAQPQNWTHPERLKAAGLPKNATRTKPPRPSGQRKRATSIERPPAAERPKGMPWEYGQQTGPVRRRVDNG